MRGLNKVQIIGRVGVIASKTSQSGVSVTTFSVAVDESYTDKQGQKIKQAEWFNCTAFNKLAEILNQYVEKGHLIYVEGSQKTEKYTDKTGIERIATKIMVNNVQFLQQKEQSNTNPYQPKPETKSYQQKDDGMPFNDDVPF